MGGSGVGWPFQGTHSWINAEIAVNEWFALWTSTELISVNRSRLAGTTPSLGWYLNDLTTGPIARYALPLVTRGDKGSVKL